MIDRYSRDAMKAVWSEDAAFDLWLKVEVAASVAWSELGVVPQADAEKIRGARFDRALYDKWFEETKHDVVSFTRAVTPSLGPEGRWVHHGLTSNDVKDTALSLQLVAAVDLIDAEVERCMGVVKTRAEELAYTPCIGRSHGVHAEPMSFGMKLALWWDELRRHHVRLRQLREMVDVGKISAPFGPYASVPPEIEVSVCLHLVLAPAPVSNQILQRDRHAQCWQTLARLVLDRLHFLRFDHNGSTRWNLPVPLRNRYRRRPHPRHWQTLARIVGVSPDMQSGPNGPIGQFRHN